MLGGDCPHEGGVVAHRTDLGAVADDARIALQPVPIVVRLEHQRTRIEAEKGRLEAGPFRLDDAPHEAGAEDALRHHGEDPVVGKRRERVVTGN
jgi:hypothetical protein